MSDKRASRAARAAELSAILAREKEMDQMIQAWEEELKMQNMFEKLSTSYQQSIEVRDRMIERRDQMIKRLREEFSMTDKSRLRWKLLCLQMLNSTAEISIPLVHFVQGTLEKENEVIRDRAEKNRTYQKWLNMTEKELSQNLMENDKELDESVSYEKIDESAINISGNPQMISTPKTDRPEFYDSARSTDDDSGELPSSWWDSHEVNLQNSTMLSPYENVSLNLKKYINIKDY